MSNNLPVQPAAPSGSGAEIAAPIFQLPIGAIVLIEGEKHHVERRLPDGRWQLLSDECTPRFLGDTDLAQMMSRGEFHLDAGRGIRAFAPPPPSPLLVGPEAHAANQRKHDYVLACLNAPGGFRRSRTALTEIIGDVSKSRDEQPPGFTTVLSWIDEWEQYGKRIGTAAYSDRHDLKGRRRDILQDYQELAMERGLEAWFQLGSKVQAYKVVCQEVRTFDREQGKRVDKAALGPKFVDDHGGLRPPCRRTFERRCANLSRFEQDWGLKGPAYAKQKNRTWGKTALEDRPYAHVEVDHTRLDLLVIDEARGLVLGRPTLTLFRDRATCMILGYGMGFEEPSYAAFLQGLKHTTYPKGPPVLPAARSDWPCYGRIENLYVDNGLEFLGDNIKAAGRELGFNLVRFQPRQPWLKGALERLYGTLNKGLLHTAAGTTLSNVLQRRDHEYLGEATLTLAELEALLDLWIRDEYHARPTRGLGFIRGVGGIPLEAWAEKAKSYRTPPLPDPDLFLSLAGEVAFRTIQNDGVTWDYITYESPELQRLLSHPKHRRRGEGGTTKYEITRDPFDLGSIIVKDPYRGERIIVPATPAHDVYARGLSLHQHRVILSNARPRKANDKIDFEDLAESRMLLARVVASLRRSPGRKKVQRAIARYLNVEQSRRHRSQVLLEPPKSRSDMIDWGSESATAPQLSPPGQLSESLLRDPAHDDASDDEDLAALRRAMNWSAYSER